MIAVKVELDHKELDKFFKHVDNVPDNVANTAHRFAEMAADSLRKQFIHQRKIAPRQKTASRMRAIRQSRFISHVVIPQSADMLDRMKPHYVSLKKGRKVTAWARKYFGNYRVTGLSKVKFTKTGGIVRGSQLYVTPDPFVETAMLKVRYKLSGMLRQEIRRTLRGG